MKSLTKEMQTEILSNSYQTHTWGKIYSPQLQSLASEHLSQASGSSCPLCELCQAGWHLSGQTRSSAWERTISRWGKTTQHNHDQRMESHSGSVQFPSFKLSTLQFLAVLSLPRIFGFLQTLPHFSHGFYLWNYGIQGQGRLLQSCVWLNTIKPQTNSHMERQIK